MAITKGTVENRSGKKRWRELLEERRRNKGKKYSEVLVITVTRKVGRCKREICKNKSSLIAEFEKTMTF